MTNELMLLFLVATLLFLILEVAAVMLRLTGLDRDTARFQAISIITASGYTTSESELVARHPVRRKIAMFLMISGTIALAFIISILVRILGRGLSGPEEVFLAVTALLIIYLLFHNPIIAGMVDRYLERQLMKQPYLNRRSVEELLKLDENYSIAEVHLSNPDAHWAGKTLAEIRPRDQGIMILSIRRDGNIIRAPRGTDDLCQGDILLVYGRPKYISQLIECVT